jgi:hypothetical protein
VSESVKHNQFVPTQTDGDPSSEPQRNTAEERSVEDRLADLLAEVEGKESGYQANYADLTAQAGDVKTKLDRETKVKTVLREALDKLRPQAPPQPEPEPTPEPEVASAKVPNYPRKGRKGK